jgi:hypothetical protein
MSLLNSDFTILPRLKRDRHFVSGLPWSGLSDVIAQVDSQKFMQFMAYCFPATINYTQTIFGL